MPAKKSKEDPTTTENTKGAEELEYTDTVITPETPELHYNAPETAPSDEFIESDFPIINENADDGNEANQPHQGEHAPIETTSLSALIQPSDNRISQQLFDANAPAVTLEIGRKVETQQDKDDEAWHEIRNSQIANRLLTGILGKVERLENGVRIAIIDYKGIRVSIPMSEMMINIPRPDGQTDEVYNIRLSQVINRMMGAEIDFIVRGTTNDGINRVAVASRKAAMMSLRRRFYLNSGVSGKPVIYPGRAVEARIVAVSDLAIRVDIFGVETTIHSAYLSWGNLGDISDEFYVGNTILVYVSDVTGDTPESIRINADLRSLTEDNTLKKLEELKLQTNCLATVTNVVKGIIILSLVDGIRAISHECLDRKGRKPGRGDQVLFVVTRKDMERGVAIGTVSRIVKRIL